MTSERDSMCFVLDGCACGACHGWCTGLQVVPACSQWASSYFSLQHILFSQKHTKRTSQRMQMLQSITCNQQFTVLSGQFKSETGCALASELL